MAAIWVMHKSVLMMVHWSWPLLTCLCISAFFSEIVTYDQSHTLSIISCFWGTKCEWAENGATEKKYGAKIAYPCQSMSSRASCLQKSLTHIARHRSVAFKFDSIKRANSGGSSWRSGNFSWKSLFLRTILGEREESWRNLLKACPILPTVLFQEKINRIIAIRLHQQSLL